MLIIAMSTTASRLHAPFIDLSQFFATSHRMKPKLPGSNDSYLSFNRLQLNHASNRHSEGCLNALIGRGSTKERTRFRANSVLDDAGPVGELQHVLLGHFKEMIARLFSTLHIYLFFEMMRACLDRSCYETSSKKRCVIIASRRITCAAVWQRSLLHNLNFRLLYFSPFKGERKSIHGTDEPTTTKSK
jgi:hypothetical protein